MRYLKLFEELKMDAKHLSENIGLSISNNYFTLYDNINHKVLASIGLSNRYKKFLTFPMVAAEKGYGPLIYEMALMYSSDKGGLMVQRDGDIRGEAFDVWEKMYYRKDVYKERLSIKDNNYNFAIVTGEESSYDPIYYMDDFPLEEQKREEYNLHKEEGFEKDIIIYNTKMWMNTTNEYYKLIETSKDWDHKLIQYKGQDFFDMRYND